MMPSEENGPAPQSVRRSVAMSEYALTANESCRPAAEAAGEALRMDEKRFAAFYERTARPLWAYLCRVSGDPAAADDLLQEAYYRLLRSRLPEMSEAQRKSYLFRIASNLLRDEWRKRRAAPPVLPQETAGEAPGRVSDAARFEQSVELGQAFAQLTARERELVWLAYAEGSSHREIAAVSGVREQSVRPLLFRARRKLAQALRALGRRHP